MQYQRRLRSRIILSFLLLGFGLTSLFAAATLYLRSRLENQLIESTLQREVDQLVEQVRADPGQRPSFSTFEAATWSPRTLHRAPAQWQNLDTGVHDMVELDEQGSERRYKLAVRRDDDLISFVRYDVSSAEIGFAQMLWLVVIAVVAFTLLAGLIGVWSSSRVISPVTDLARRLSRLRGGDAPEKLAANYPDDEVGELAAALDDYALRMTALVRRDREFNADVSHELRTPLAVIRSTTELLLAKPGIDDKLRERLRRIERAAQQSTDLTTALLLLSRNERGTGNTDVRKLCEQLAEAHRAQLGGKPVAIAVQGETDLFVEAPEAVLSVALGNLIGNACKYTQEGEVSIRIEPERVRIADTGPGLSKEDAERLFERGYRGQAATGTHGGGIGLSIVIRLCELYGWKVGIAPRPERGAEAVLAFDPGN
jgi:signal transduction histidine kinase